MKKTFLLSALVICFCFTALSQDNNAGFTQVISKIKTFSGDHIAEKAYLHFDKPYYAAGDTIHFKAYVT